MNQRRTLQKYTVIKLAKLVKSTKNEGELLFKDSTGRIYFLDKKGNNDLVKELPVDEFHHIWVVKECDRVGYARVSIDGISVVDHLLNIFKLTVNDYLETKDSKRDDSVFLTNYMYNHDIEFNKYLEKDTDDERSDVEIELFNHFDRIGTNSEWAEFIQEKATLDRYIMNISSRNRKK